MGKKIHEQNFETEILEAKGTCLVDFYADWCGPCKMIAPIVDEIAEEQTDLVVGKINVDECPNLAMRYQIMSIPALLVFKDGQEHTRLIGFHTKEEILSALE